MTIQSPPFVLQNSSHSAELVRRETQAELPFGSAGGVVPATAVSTAALTSDLQVTAPVSGMTVLVSSGGAFVPGSLGSGSGYGMGTGYGYPVITTNGTSAPTIAANAHATVITLTTQGVYYCYNDNASGKVSLAIASSNPSNPRIDVVGMQVEDAVYSGSNNDWKLAVITGTAASSPVVPTFPANFLPLSLVWVPAAATNIVSADIVDLRVNYNRNPLSATIHAGTTTSLSAASFTVVTMNTVDNDLTGSWNGSNTWTVPFSGRYLVSATVSIATADRSTTAIYINGSEVKQAVQVNSGAIATSTLALLNLKAGDTIQAAVFVVNASNNSMSGSSVTWMDIQYLAAT